MLIWPYQFLFLQSKVTTPFSSGIHWIPGQGGRKTIESLKKLTVRWFLADGRVKQMGARMASDSLSSEGEMDEVAEE